MKKYITTYQEYLDYWGKIQDKVPLNIVCIEIKCKFCFSRNIIKYGHFKTMQRWWCKDCQRKFADNGASPYMRTHNDLVSFALVMYYNGMSLNTIRKQLKKHYYSDFSVSTIYEWIHKYSDDAIKNTRKYVPNVGNVWVVDKNMVPIDGKSFWLVDIMDAKTRYLLASIMNINQTDGDARTIIKYAIQKAEKAPRLILTGKPDIFCDGIDTTFGDDNKQVSIKYLAARQKNSIIERFHYALQQRTTIMQSLKNSINAELIMKGWIVHYNYFRLQEGLQNRTPSELAGIDHCMDENWLIIVKHVREIAQYWQKDINWARHRSFSVPSSGVYTGNTDDLY